MANRRVKGGEHAGIGQDTGAREPVEQRGFSGIRISDERDGGQRHRLPLPTLNAAPGPHVLELIVEFLDASVNAAAVGFEFRLAGTARSNAATKARHLYAVSGEPRQEVIQ